jgi:hypothetical protein
MKKILLPILFFLFLSGTKAQIILNMPTIVQEQNQWCWAGSTKCIMDYYGFNYQQCNIAEYTRTVAVWHNFGNVDCCVTGSVDCNYWNYNWGNAGSMQDILQTMASINNYGISSDLTTAQIVTNIDAGLPFIIRWGWNTGGGHFIVGKGYANAGNNVYYMNPWPGEGSKTATYAWMQNDGSHTWTHTYVLTTAPSPTILKKNILSDAALAVFPNPAINTVNISTKNRNTSVIKLTDMNGKIVLEKTLAAGAELNVSQLPEGLYQMSVSNDEGQFHQKLMISRN